MSDVLRITAGFALITAGTFLLSLMF